MLAKEILLKAKKNVFTNKTADNLSITRGEGLDFCEIRPYQFGDDVRHINFSASGKTGELQTNVFNENKQLNVVIAPLLSASLHFGSVCLKSEKMAEIIAHLGYSSIKQKNQTKVVFFAQEALLFNLNNEGDLLKAIEYMLEVDLLKNAYQFQMLKEYFIRTKKSLGFIISDFYQQDDYAQIAHKNQIKALTVRDRLEELPNFSTELNLVSAYDNSVIEANIGKNMATKYQNRLAVEDDKLNAHFSHHNIETGKIYTDDDVFIKLSQILK
ncbi:hypothetical protein SPONN_907 [uncultured Candidatus Thioglobus sp.]|nr:hypothetical protein SPONN_907 [uncultured Candidatus Thioglobus sp.]